MGWIISLIVIFTTFCAALIKFAIDDFQAERYFAGFGDLLSASCTIIVILSLIFGT